MEIRRVQLRKRLLALNLFSLASRYGGFGFFVAFAGAFGGALVPVLFALGEGDFAFDAAVAEVEFDRDEGEAFLGGKGF